MVTVDFVPRYNLCLLSHFFQPFVLIVLDTAAGVWLDRNGLVTSRSGKGHSDSDHALELMRRCRHAAASIGVRIYIYGGLRGGRDIKHKVFTIKTVLKRTEKINFLFFFSWRKLEWKVDSPKVVRMEMALITTLLPSVHLNIMYLTRHYLDEWPWFQLHFCLL